MPRVLAILSLSILTLDGNPSSAVSFDAPATVVKALTEARIALEAVARCGGSNEQFIVELVYKDFEKRYYAALRRAEGIWGDAVLSNPELEEVVSERLACGRIDIRYAVRESEIALENEERIFSQATAAMRFGAWAGPLKLCRQTVTVAEPGQDYLSNQPTIFITLDPRSAALFSSLTDRSINGPLAIRLNGEVIAEPIVFERIEGGQFQVTGPEAPVLERLREAVDNRC